jgi:hypothetical protein
MLLGLPPHRALLQKRLSLTAFVGISRTVRRFLVSPKDSNADPIVIAEHFVRLKCYGNDRSLLGIPPTAFSEFQSPAP